MNPTSEEINANADKFLKEMFATVEDFHCTFMAWEQKWPYMSIPTWRERVLKTACVVFAEPCQLDSDWMCIWKYPFNMPAQINIKLRKQFKETILKYAKHTSDCRVNQSWSFSRTCSCGFDEVMKLLND